MEMNPRWLVSLAVLVPLSLALAARSGNFLVIDAFQPSDVILVLAGETNHRPARALELLAQGYGRRMVLDVSARGKIYQLTELQLAEKYIRDLPQAAQIVICPIEGLSTKDESKDAEKCLAREGGGSVLIVTSDFHTRRAWSVFRREVPGHVYSVAAARDPEQFGAKWWTHRQWAKTLLDEWLRFIWWKVVDEWH
jgi:hypothetical protein